MRNKNIKKQHSQIKALNKTRCLWTRHTKHTFHVSSNESQIKREAKGVESTMQTRSLHGNKKPHGTNPQGPRKAKHKPGVCEAKRAD